jgi:hypothetical protein
MTDEIITQEQERVLAAGSVAWHQRVARTAHEAARLKTAHRYFSGQPTAVPSTGKRCRSRPSSDGGPRESGFPLVREFCSLSSSVERRCHL